MGWPARARFLGRLTPARALRVHREFRRLARQKGQPTPPRYQVVAQQFLRRLYGQHWGLGAWIPVEFWDRSACLSRAIRGATLRVYRGRRWRRLFITRWQLGYATGEFARTRRVAHYRARVRLKKKLRRERGRGKAKKRQPVEQPGLAFIRERRLEAIRQVKMGKLRLGAQFDPILERQLRRLEVSVGKSEGG